MYMYMGVYVTTFEKYKVAKSQKKKENSIISRGWF